MFHTTVMDLRSVVCDLCVGTSGDEKWVKG